MIYTFRENYEPELTIFLSRLSPGDVVVDVGANLGIYTLLAAARVQPTGRIIALEPTPTTCRYLRQSVNLNSFENVSVIQAGLGAHRGIASLTTHPDSSRNSLVTDGRNRGGVTILPLDEVVEGAAVTKVTCLKIDVEGMEGAVLEGAARTLRLHRPWILVEMNAGAAESAGLDPDSARRQLVTVGYRLEVLQYGRLVSSSNPSTAGVTNVMAFPTAR